MLTSAKPKIKHEIFQVLADFLTFLIPVYEISLKICTIRGENTGGGGAYASFSILSLDRSMTIVHFETKNQSKNWMAFPSYKMAVSRFAERGKGNVKEIIVDVKNAVR